MAARNRPTTPTPAGSSAGTRPDAPADGLVLGELPVLARAAGVLLLLAGLVGAVAVFPTQLVVGGRDVSLVTGPLDAVVALVGPVVTVLVALGLVAGRVPRLGLAYAVVTGALAVGQLLVQLYLGRASTDRPAVEVLAGERVVTSSVDPGAGWALGLVGLGLSVLAAVAALLAWERTVMEDGGSLDPVRPVLAGAVLVTGVAAVLCLALPPADVPDRVVTDPSTGLETVVAAQGPQALLERPGLALLGGLLLAAALLLCAVVAPSLRPRLGAVGGLLGIAAFLLAAALTGLRDAAHSAALVWTVPGVGLLVLAVVSAGLTVLAWRWRRGVPPGGSRRPADV